MQQFTPGYDEAAGLYAFVTIASAILLVAPGYGGQPGDRPGTRGG